MWISKDEYDVLKRKENEHDQWYKRRICQSPIMDNGLSEKVHNLEKRIFELEYDIKNPPKYNISQNTKYGTCVGSDIITEQVLPKIGCTLISYKNPGYKMVRRYTFMKGSVKTVITE